MIYETEEQLLYKAKEAEGKTFGEIDVNNRIGDEKGKGHLGQIIEESFFGYKVNSKAEADFKELGIELKVTPVRKNKKGVLSAKERLVLNIINYHQEINQTFESSSFWSKNKFLLLMFYEWIPEIRRADYKILKSYLHQFSEEDLEIIRADWEFIIKKIKAGKAHELSEGDTVYLGACTKGANKKSVRTQPFSDIPAMQRAYSLKQGYMTTLARQVITDEHLISIINASELRKKSFEQLLNERFSPFIGKSLDKLSIELDIPVNTESKNFLQKFISSLLGIDGTSLKDIDEFAKANIHFKTVRLEPSGMPKEHMSFKNIDFKLWLDEEWEDSWVRQNFEVTKYLFIVFEYKETERQNLKRKLYFKGIKLWNMPMNEIEGPLKKFWLEVKQILLEGVVFEEKPWGSKTRTFNNLPSPGTNGICHIRPKAQNSKDKVRLPQGTYITKQAFWLDKDYISKILFYI